VRQLCNGLGPDLEQECRDALLDCCSTLGKCKAAKSTECLLSKLVIIIDTN
jgi:hypothetical protein